jgi:hypothetical protein
MSIAEKAADLYLIAVNEGLPKLFKDPENGLDGLYQSFKTLQIPLLQHKVIIKNPDPKSPNRWIKNDDAEARRSAVDHLDKETTDDLESLFRNVIAEHEFAADNLIESGKSYYLAQVRNEHGDIIEELNPRVETTIKEDSMQAVASSMLNVLQTVHDDPANAAFVKGLDKGMLDEISGIMHASGYLMPGENEDRTADLGDQVLRGSKEDQATLFEFAAMVAANIEAPESFKQGDKCTAAAIKLQQAVAGAEFDETRVTSSAGRVADEYADSSLDIQSASALYTALQAANSMMSDADQDPEDMQCLTVNQDQFAAALEAFRNTREMGVEDALKHHANYLPGIDTKTVQNLGEAMDFFYEGLTTDARSLAENGNEGELTLNGEQADTWDQGAFGGDEEADASDEKDEDAKGDEVKGVTSKGKEKVYQVAEMGVAEYGRSENKRRIIEGLVAPLDNMLHAGVQNGMIGELARHAGRPDEKWATREAPEYGNQEQFLDTGVIGPASVSFASMEMTKARFKELPKDRREKMRTVEITPGRGVWKGYRPGTPENTPKKIAKYVRDNMLLPDGKPNLKMRNWLQDANHSVILGTFKSEVQAGREISDKFVEYSRAEHQNRVEASQKKSGITDISMKSSDLMRFLDVARAANPDKAEDELMARVTLSPEGVASLSRDDSPKISGKMSNVPKEIENGAKAGRPFGGNIDLAQLQAAVHGGREEVTVRCAGEVVVAAYAKVDEQKVMSKKKSRFDSYQLS